MKIAIVNDMAVIAEALRRAVSHTQEHQVIWVAQSGAQAVRFCAENRPDLILMDLLMPDMDGVEATRLIMQRTPCAILIVTTSPQDNTNQIFRALGAGALDVTATPVMSGNRADDSTLQAKIKTIGKLIAANTLAGGLAAPLTEALSAVPHPRADMLIAIGASTGGPVALTKILRNWTPARNCALVIVQHIDQAFTDGFARWLAEEVNYPVGVIEDGSYVMPGAILIAKTNDHVTLDERGRLSYSVAPSDYPYRPSIDVFFHCIARHWRKKAIGVLLSGMGHDGAKGLLAMRRAGKLTIAQDQASSAVYGMPRAAAQINAAELILPLDKIAPTLHQRAGGKIDR